MVSIAATEPAVLSVLESERFAVRVARARVAGENLLRILDFCTSNQVDLLIARCAGVDLVAAQSMERQGFLLMDTLVYYSFDLAKRAVPRDGGTFLIRSLRPEDREQVRAVGAAAFKGYVGHYHADPRLDRKQCDEAYASWAERSCVERSAADHVLVAEHEGTIAGFATLRQNTPDEVEGLLYAVAPKFQGLGICPSLMIHSLEWTRSHSAARMVISTQVTNVAMQKVWCRTGFEPSHSYYTFHKWFDQ